MLFSKQLIKWKFFIWLLHPMGRVWGARERESSCWTYYCRPHIVYSLKILNLIIFPKFKTLCNDITTTSNSNAHWRLWMKNLMHFCECTSRNTYSAKTPHTKSQFTKRPIWTKLWFVNYKSSNGFNKIDG